MLKRALILTWSGFQDQEVLYPFYRLQEDGFSVTIVAERPGPIVGITGIKMNADTTYLDLQGNGGVQYVLANYDLIVLPGGVKALEKLRQDDFIRPLLLRWNEQGRVIASTCHGAQLLISAKIVQGRKISGYYSIEDDIVNAGGIYSREPFVTDGNIVSSPHYKDMPFWIKETLRVYYELEGRRSL